MTSLEPPKKIPKIMSKEEPSLDKLAKDIKNSSSNLKPVVNEELYRDIPLIKVFVATIKNPKDISKIILKLNQEMPLNNLQHLKRVSKKEIILCPVEVLKGESIENYFQEKFADLEGSFESFKELSVPCYPPKIKRQFEKCNKIWPCNFHPNKYNEKLVSGTFFSEEELKIHRQFMGMVCETALYHIKQDKNQIIECNVAVIVDPTIQSVVAISFENKSEHPIQHAAMLAIDNVAKTQNGGAWVANREKLETIDSTMRGIDEDLYSYMKTVFPDVKFGAKTTKTSENISAETVPYLCTNYDVYLLRESCIMCSMALVHARAKRVFFCTENRYFGGLKSKCKLHTVASLNHHFEVFTGFL